MKYFCEHCNKTYKNANSLYSHRSKYHNSNSNTDVNQSPKKSNIISCNFCHKQFKHNSNRYRHQKNCHLNPDIVTNTVSKHQSLLNNNQLSNILSQDKSTIESLIKVLSESISKDTNSMAHSQNMTNSQNLTNSQNTTINNTVVVSLGNENVQDKLSTYEQVNILKQKNKALEELIKLVHFSNKYPQFHNIAIDNDVAYKYDDESKGFKEIAKYDLIKEVIEERAGDIYDFNEANKLYTSKKTYNIINNELFKMDKIEAEREKVFENTEDIICTGTDYLLENKKIKLIKKSIH